MATRQEAEIKRAQEEVRRKSAYSTLVAGIAWEYLDEFLMKKYLTSLNDLMTKAGDDEQSRATMKFIEVIFIEVGRNLNGLEAAKENLRKKLEVKR